MTNSILGLSGASIFYDSSLQSHKVLLVEHGKFLGIVDRGMEPAGTSLQQLEDGYLVPGYVDLQVNGGGGVMFNTDPSIATLETMLKAHQSVGATSILPTLITDTPEKTLQAIDAVADAISLGVEGIEGLHLEGPHLSLNKKGAHCGDLIRSMKESDLAVLLSARKKISTLKLTVSPEQVSSEQIGRLVDAGIIVSLGHTDNSFEESMNAARSGASCVTHLFNAMSQLTAREPGLVGATLTSTVLSAGIIADGIHVHRENLLLAVNAKASSGKLFLVSDAMAVAGTDDVVFELNGRPITRNNGKLTLSDGTLAGADLDLSKAIRLLLQQNICDLTTAISMATCNPAWVIGKQDTLGVIKKDLPANFLWLDESLHLRKVWMQGDRIF